MNLQELMKHFFELYGKRNRIFLQNLLQRIVFLNLAIADLQDAIRKQANSSDLETALARVVARIFCIADYFGDPPITLLLAQKYPKTHCSYCKTIPCTCAERRPDYSLENAPSAEQLLWSLGQWCEHFKIMYGSKNQTKGIENLMNRLYKEISELLTLAMKTPSKFSANTTIDDVETEFSKELCDALAWTIAIANYLEINLEKAVITRYGEVCWKCHKKPCVCTAFSMDQVEWPSTK